MKRKLSTIVLFVLLALTVVALTRLDSAEALESETSKAAVGSQHGTN